MQIYYSKSLYPYFVASENGAVLYNEKSGIYIDDEDAVILGKGLGNKNMRIINKTRGILNSKHSRLLHNGTPFSW